MTVNLESVSQREMVDGYEEIISSVVEAALDYVDCPYEAIVDVTLMDNADIQEINAQFREMDRATDVLSFPFLEFETPKDFSICEECPASYFDAETGELMLGEIYISMDKVYEQAELYGHSPRRELAFLVAHSMLHLSGFDHVEEDERIEMERMQEEILQSKGYTREL